MEVRVFILWFIVLYTACGIVIMTILALYRGFGRGKRFKQRIAREVLKIGDVIKIVTEVNVRNPRVELCLNPTGYKNGYCEASHFLCNKAYYCEFMNSDKVAVFQMSTTEEDALKVGIMYKIKNDNRKEISFHEFFEIC